MKYLTAEKQAMQFYFKVHMDETRPQAPDNVREFTWGLIPPQGQTETQYLANIKNEIALLVADELSHVASTPAPTPLAGF